RARRRPPPHGVRAAERCGQAVGNDRAAAARHPPWHRRGMMRAQSRDHRAMTQQRPDIARLLQVTAGIVDPKNLAPRGKAADEAMAAIGDGEIRAFRYAFLERRPGNAVVRERRGAAVAHQNAMAARGKGLGERDERAFGTTERRALLRLAIE